MAGNFFGAPSPRRSLHPCKFQPPRPGPMILGLGEPGIGATVVGRIAVDPEVPMGTRALVPVRPTGLIALALLLRARSPAYASDKYPPGPPYRNCPDTLRIYDIQQPDTLLAPC